MQQKEDKIEHDIPTHYKTEYVMYNDDINLVTFVFINHVL